MGRPENEEAEEREEFEAEVTCELKLSETRVFYSNQPADSLDFTISLSPLSRMDPALSELQQLNEEVARLTALADSAFELVGSAENPEIRAVRLRIWQNFLDQIEEIDVRRASLAATLMGQRASRRQSSFEADTRKYSVAGGRCFAEGTTVNPPFECFVETPSDEKLADAMFAGSYCLLVGHRQAGKSSTVIAAEMKLQEGGSSLDIYHVTLFGTLTSESQLWQQLGQRLNYVDSSRFPAPNEKIGFDAETFFSWFMPKQGRSAVALVIDEAANMANIQDLSAVLSAFRVCRDQKPHGWLLHSLVLVGTERIVSMVVTANSSGAQLVSPFTVDKNLYPEPFSEANLECLLEQFCSRKLLQLEPSPSGFAADIWQRTMGHRGLSILCCSELEELMVQRSTLELDVWQKHAFERLVQTAAGRSTYERLLRDLADLPDLPHALLEEVLLRRACWVQRSHPAVSLLLDRGFVHTMPMLSSGSELLADAVKWPGSTGEKPDTLLTTAAPLLASLLLSRAAFSIDLSVLQDRPKDQGEFGMWLLESALQLADEQILTQPEVQLKGKNKQGQVAEYSWQTQFGVLARSILLSLPDLSPRWFLLPEVTAAGAAERLDWLLRNGVGPFGFEFVIRATQSEMEEHIQRSTRFAQRHQAHVYTVNIALPGDTGRMPKMPLLPHPSSEIYA
ncbi:hypothetical protein COCOBI_01-4060 [Coccomyxa sp. Obi]|nr:hypothetical protein COCOBI_01-4060 [Coccomyxa sp. Obi]